MIEGSTVYTLAPWGRGMGGGETTHYKIGLAGNYAIGIYIGRMAGNFILNRNAMRAYEGTRSVSLVCYVRPRWSVALHDTFGLKNGFGIPPHPNPLPGGEREPFLTFSPQRGEGIKITSSPLETVS